jgi:hypothetical protein
MFKNIFIFFHVTVIAEDKTRKIISLALKTITAATKLTITPLLLHGGSNRK